MTTRKRKGMLIKNTNVRPVVIEMQTRTLSLQPGEEQLVTAEEVRDARLRELLQVRAVSIVRPAMEGEEEAFLATLSEGAGSTTEEGEEAGAEDPGDATATEA